MKLLWAEEAMQDIADIDHYLTGLFPKKRQSTLQYISDQADRLLEMPHLGRIGKVQGTRELVLGSLPYILVYKVEEYLLHILHVQHTSRNYP